jgi:hypothetical protein
MRDHHVLACGSRALNNIERGHDCGGDSANWSFNITGFKSVGSSTTPRHSKMFFDSVDHLAGGQSFVL